MKTIYFVRHGESDANVGERFSDDETVSLTQRGRSQAEALAKRCAKLPIDAIISSTMPRASETAAIISEAIGMPFELSAEFTERPLPISMHGRLRTDEAARRILEGWGKKTTEEGDEFERLKDRAGRALTLLADRPESHILVVSHGFFMRMVLARVIFGEEFTSDELGHILRAIPSTEKSHISVFRYHEDGREDPWKLWVWNDHAHLG
ncbi:MAG: Phosphoglycerate mutase [Candidatus Kaiserbacteria bacterium GW2011_GWB1_52_6]|uniref:Phosphoglycerate mutase n=3 Tax=Candidatus Kaiseribacteriota TaxID=1752734 RepID=A0A0G1ZR81_9BACT|nr:MAG: Phosphoglycerate mutase [Candidatus Kaiserbacteria bacterium GW2011_GWA2_52_12]KKW26537.1 MAG: Phosphoglycerate mutase [Candidatus Kaiserbacteria bacterium GW2011_GWB1_52_6]KKW30742.1 MAG: Phosphoglycerate mutase [Candidatus Kaiserbacteria bacterium GW2011_GWC2_52_8b]